MGRFKRHVFVCENERPEDHPRGDCLARGSGNLRKILKEKLKSLGVQTEIRANKAGCMDACELGPTVVVYPEGVWYGGVQEEDLDEIIERHLIGGEPVERLRIKDEKYNRY